MRRPSSRNRKIGILTVVDLQWDLPSPIFFGWTADENLLVLAESGVYRIYDLVGDYRQYSLGSEIDSLGVISAQIHDAGFVALLGDLSFVQVKGWEGGRPSSLAASSMCHCTKSP